MDRIAVVAATLLVSAISPFSARAEQVPGVIALTPQERAAVLDAASRRPDAGLGGIVPDRSAHGEVGFEIGSRGERALFGSTIVPLGDHGAAAFSFVTGQTGRWPR